MGVVIAVPAELDALFRRFPIDGIKPKSSERGPVCVTSGGSFLGFALVRLLLRRGYLVRVAVDSEGDVEKLREAEEAMQVAVVDVTEVESLRGAFDGCVAVFHTSSHVDSQGISGYTKPMADMEVVVAENVLEACARTSSVRKCVFTSSLLACTWQRSYSHHIVDERCWSDEDLCRENKLWLALGKTMAERAAWRRARGTRIKLATICLGLVVGGDFHVRNTTTSIAYLKGGSEMYRRNVLATVDVDKVVEAHVLVYEATSDVTAGRYICFDHIIGTTSVAAELERKLHLLRRISDVSNITSEEEEQQQSVVSNKKLSALASRAIRCVHHMYHSNLD